MYYSKYKQEEQSKVLLQVSSRISISYLLAIYLVTMKPGYNHRNISPKVEMMGNGAESIAPMFADTARSGM